MKTTKTQSNNNSLHGLGLGERVKKNNKILNKQKKQKNNNKSINFVKGFGTEHYFPLKCCLSFQITHSDFPKRKVFCNITVILSVKEDCEHMLFPIFMTSKHRTKTSEIDICSLN
jgi:hypothetical protein